MTPYENLETWHFGTDNDKLVGLVLSGKKTATTYLYTPSSPSEIGEEAILTYDNGRKACITKTTQVIITEFKNITWELARLEGESNNLSEWQASHQAFFAHINPDFNHETKVVFEIFEIIKI